MKKYRSKNKDELTFKGSELLPSAIYIKCDHIFLCIDELNIKIDITQNISQFKRLFINGIKFVKENKDEK